jgi:predicted DNA-binding protein
MRLMMGGINGRYLREIIESHIEETEEVLAAVAYATPNNLLLD